MILRRFALIGAACAAMLGCGKDSTAPAEFGQVTLVIKNPGSASASTSATASQFGKVRIILKRAGGATAVDTTIAFPATAAELPVTVSLPLTPGTPATGEPMSLSLEYLNAAGATVFKGGPVTVTLVRAGSGQSTVTGVQTPLTYTGPGANATEVRISPRGRTAFVGDSLGFSATAHDAAGAVIANTPILWFSPDTAIATVTSFALGTIRARAAGSARIYAQLLNGPSDMVTLTVQPRP